MNLIEEGGSARLKFLREERTNRYMQILKFFHEVDVPWGRSDNYNFLFYNLSSVFIYAIHVDKAHHSISVFSLLSFFLWYAVCILIPNWVPTFIIKLDIVQGYRLDDWNSSTSRGWELFIFATVSKLALGPTQPLTQLVPVTLGVKQLKLTAQSHLVPRSECLKLYLHSPITPLWCGA
jgi:hypothetical protein